MTLHVVINGVERGPLGSAIVRGLSVKAASLGKNGTANIELLFDASLGYTFLNTQEVKVYDLVSGTANGMFGGFIRNTTEIVRKGTSQKYIVIRCDDYNVLLDAIVRDASDASMLTISAGTFHAQVAALVQAMQWNGNGTVNQTIDATTYVQHLTGASVLPAVTVKGESLRDGLQKIMSNARAANSALRPRFSLMLMSDGAGGVICALVVWDGAAPPAAVATFSTTPGVGQQSIFDYTRTLDGSMPLTNRRQLIWAAHLGTFVYTYASIGTTYTNPYINHGLTGGKGYWMDKPVQGNQVASSSDAQNQINIIGQSKEFPRETFSLTGDKASASTLFIRPGETVHIITDAVASDYEVTEVQIGFPNMADPSYQRLSMTCGLPLLGLLQNGSDGVAGAPVTGDISPPNAPTSVAVTANIYNEQNGEADLYISYTASTSIDVQGYVVIFQTPNYSSVFDVGNVLTPMIEVQSGVSFNLWVVAYDSAHPPNYSSQSNVVSGVTASPTYYTLFNPSFEMVSGSDATLPAGWTRAVSAGGTTARVTTQHNSGVAALELSATIPSSSAEMLCAMVVNGNNLGYQLRFFAKGASGVQSLTWKNTWYDSDGVTILGTSTGSVNPGLSWTRFDVGPVPAAGTAFWTLKFSQASGTAKIWVDTVSMIPALGGKGIEDGSITPAKTNFQINGGSDLNFYDENGLRTASIYWATTGTGRLVLHTVNGDPGHYTAQGLTLQGGIANPSTVDIYDGQVDVNTGTVTLASNALNIISATKATFSSMSVVLASGAIPTTATDGFVYLGSCAGTPTGTPTTQTGTIPLVWDSTHNILYAFISPKWTPISTGQGSSFPGSPITGFPFFRTDIGETCSYDGTRWLGPEFPIAGWAYYPGAQAAAEITATQEYMNVALRKDFATRITRLSYFGYVNGTNNGTNYWKLHLRTFTGQVDLQTTPENTSGWAGVTWTHPNDVTTFNTQPSTSDMGLEWYVEKIGAPGPLRWFYTVYASIVYT